MHHEEEAAFRLDPKRALKAIVALTRNPDDTSQVFTIIESLSGHAPQRLVDGFRASASGRRLLAERPDIVPLLADRARLRAMPEGSLAHAYLAFVESENITADGLVAASEAGEIGLREKGSDLDYISQRLRDTHDLWHAISGYKGDLIGEASLLGFSLAQTHNPGIAMIVVTGIFRIRQLDAVGLIAGGIKRGLAAAWFPAVEWEDLLPLPLEAVRSRLGIEAAPAYEPLRTSALRAEGILEPIAA
ncbi:MAG: Coq4 family protein [Sandaracinus sp.]